MNLDTVASSRWLRSSVIALLLVASAGTAIANEPGLVDAYIPVFGADTAEVRKVTYWAKFPVNEAPFAALCTPYRPSPLGEAPPWPDMNLASQAGLKKLRVELFPADQCKISVDVRSLHPVRPKTAQKTFSREEILSYVLEALRLNLGLVGQKRCALSIDGLSSFPELANKEFPKELLAPK